MSRHRLFSKSPTPRSIHPFLPVRPQGPTPISEYIEDAFGGPDLLPRDAVTRHRSRLWSKQIDDSLHLNIFVLTFAAIGREMFRQLPPDKLEQLLPGLADPIKRKISRDLFDNGWTAPWPAMAVKRLVRLTEEMDDALADSRHLAGDAYTLCDADLTPYVNRMLDLGLGDLVEKKPRLVEWFARMRNRPSYDLALTTWESEAEAARYAAARDRSGDEIARLIAEARRS